MSAALCGAWNTVHDCLRPAGHSGDHWCGGWDAWQHNSSPSYVGNGQRVGCGDVWNPSPEYDDCDHTDESCDCDWHEQNRERDHPRASRCCTVGVGVSR